MLDLARTDAGSTSPLLNLESVLTALLAWVAFRGRRHAHYPDVHHLHGH